MTKFSPLAKHPETVTSKYVDADWFARLQTATNKFSSPIVRQMIEEKSQASAEFVLKNRDSYKQDASPSPHVPIWPSLDWIDDFEMIESRRLTLRDKVYEHGLFHMYRELEKGADIPLVLLTEKLIGLLDGNTYSVTRHLSACKRKESLIRSGDLPTSTKSAGSSISLKDFSSRYGYTTDKARDTKLLPLVEAGIYSARFNAQWSISIGPVAEAFYRNVFYPSVQHFDPTITKGQ